MEPFDLSGKTYLVTGASSGIGRACAEMMARLGATVVATGRRADALAQTCAALGPDRPHRALAGDLADADFVARLVRAAGPLDGLVHAAGDCLAMPVASAPSASPTVTLPVPVVMDTLLPAVTSSPMVILPVPVVMPTLPLAAVIFLPTSISPSSVFMVMSLTTVTSLAREILPFPCASAFNDPWAFTLSVTSRSLFFVIRVASFPDSTTPLWLIPSLLMMMF